jgi:hypothetical protein
MAKPSDLSPALAAAIAPAPEAAPAAAVAPEAAPAPAPAPEASPPLATAVLLPDGSLGFASDAPPAPEDAAPSSPYPPQAGSAASLMDGPAVAVTSSGSAPPAGLSLMFTEEEVRKVVKASAEQLTAAIAAILEQKASEFRSASKGRADMSLCSTEFTLVAARVRGLTASIDLRHTVAGHDN